MENASKALLIAGAIIITLGIISIAVMIYSGARGLVSNSNIDSTVVTAHNARFSEYIGDFNGSQVKTCISTVLANNYNEGTLPEYKVEVSVKEGNVITEYVKFDDPSNKVGSGKKQVCDNISTNIKSNNSYSGDVEYSPNGVITKIEFTRNTR